MNREARVVIGANFGDEGKGLMTDYLARRMGGTGVLVIRYNGGAQAGHTVVTPDGKRHVFHHIGSGTFAGASTFLGPQFIVNPLLWRKEMTEIGALQPTVYIDPDAMVSTPYDMLLNQMAEDLRGDERHGSCGIGICETMTRELHSDERWRVRARDLADPWALRTKLHDMRAWYVPQRLQQLGLPIEGFARDVLDSEKLIRDYTDDAAQILVQAQLMDWAALSHKWPGQFLFEGAQGLQLDEGNVRFYPHVTWSKPGLQNVVQLAVAGGIEHLSVHYVTRAYLTRHGAGPLPGELPHVPYPEVADSTNVENQWQGSLRYAYLDVNLIEEAIGGDLSLAIRQFEPTGGTIQASLAMTCCDQLAVNNVAWVEDGYTENGDLLDLIEVLEFYAVMPVRHLSFGPTHNDVGSQVMR